MRALFRTAVTSLGFSPGVRMTSPIRGPNILSRLKAEVGVVEQSGRRCRTTRSAIRAAFETAERLAVPGRRHVAFGIRGARGTAINEALAATLAELVRARPVRLVVTAREGAADDRNAAAPEERERVLGALGGAGARSDYEQTVRGAVQRTLDRAGPRNLVVLLGAQGMDRAAPMPLEGLSLGSRPGDPRSDGALRRGAGLRHRRKR